MKIKCIIDCKNRKNWIYLNMMLKSSDCFVAFLRISSSLLRVFIGTWFWELLTEELLVVLLVLRDRVVSLELMNNFLVILELLSSLLSDWLAMEYVFWTWGERTRRSFLECGCWKIFEFVDILRSFLFKDDSADLEGFWGKLIVIDSLTLSSDEE